MKLHIEYEQQAESKLDGRRRASWIARREDGFVERQDAVEVQRILTLSGSDGDV